MNLEARTSEIRDTASEYAGIDARLRTLVSGFSSAASEASAAVTHPAVQAALSTSTGAVLRQLVVAGLGVAHCQQGLGDTADLYDATDTAAANRIKEAGGAR